MTTRRKMLQNSKIRIKSLDQLLPQSSNSSSLKECKSECDSLDCFDLTTDEYSTPINTNNLSTKPVKRRPAATKSSAPSTIKQTKLNSFFQPGAPKKIKHDPPQVNTVTTTSVNTSSRQPKRKTARRNLNTVIAEKEAKSKKSKKSPKPKQSSEINLPTVTEVIDLCLDSDDEEPKKEPLSPIKSPITSKRPATIPSEKSKCPSYKVIEGTTFAVDAFKYGRISNVTVYFLTHFHADHYIGLTQKFSMPIYASQITVNLMQQFIPVDEKLITVLHLHKTICIDGVAVTAIDANHCPGAVMLLFQLPCGKRILHTGDFRACPEMEVNPFLAPRNIDILYLDTTYISSKYSFQPQANSISDAIELVGNFIERNEGKRILFVCGAYLVGKEKFWSPIAKRFDLKIWTDPKRRKVLQAIENDEIQERLVIDAHDADLHVVSLMKVGYKGIHEYWKEFSDSFDMILAIRPSGWEKNSRPQYRGDINIVGIEYSEHSSHAELRRFLAFLKPNEVISTVPTGRDCTKGAEVPLSWYKEHCFSPVKKQASIFDYFHKDKNKRST